jgi:hypothetical protein
MYEHHGTKFSSSWGGREAPLFYLFVLVWLMNMTKGIVLERLIQRKKSQNLSPTPHPPRKLTETMPISFWGGVGEIPYWWNDSLELNGLINIIYSIFFQLSFWMGGILLVLCKLVNVHCFSKEMYTYTSGLNHLTLKREIVIPKNHHVYQKQNQNVIWRFSTCF